MSNERRGHSKENEAHVKDERRSHSASPRHVKKESGSYKEEPRNPSPPPRIVKRNSGIAINERRSPPPIKEESVISKRESTNRNSDVRNESYRRENEIIVDRDERNRPPNPQASQIIPDKGWEKTYEFTDYKLERGPPNDVKKNQFRPFNTEDHIERCGAIYSSYDRADHDREVKLPELTKGTRTRGK